MAELGRSDEALLIIRSTLGRSHDRVGRWTLDTEASAFAILNEGEHGDVHAALVLAEDLRATLATRATPPVEIGGVEAILARLRLLAGEIEAAETAARNALDNLAGDPGVLLVRSIATETLAAILLHRGETRAASVLISEIVRSGSILRGHSLLESAAELAISLGRLADAADLLATSSHARDHTGRPPVPVDRPRLAGLSAAVAQLDGRFLTADEAVEVIRSLAMSAEGEAQPASSALSKMAPA